MKRIISILCFFTITLFSNNSYGQHFFSNFDKNSEAITVYNESKKVFKFPWAGGMNSCQFSEIDLNLDGVHDLFVFDRHGDRILTFINGGAQGEVDYNYAPEYIGKFPELFDWAILIDYDMDGKKDIFTYSKDFPGIIVYKNISNTELDFKLEVYPFLTTYQGGGYVNLLVTDVDYPGICDVDNDGDIDILTFSALGAFVDYHQNQSIEKYGIPDSLDFVRVSSCWGYFAENDESNVVYLDTCVGGKNCKLNRYENNSVISDKDGYRHTGSTFLLIDLDGDADKDLILGDVDYPNLVELINGGTPDSAYMISQDTLFPSYNIPVNVFSMPAAAYIDINNNGINDLIVSPFDPSLITSRNFESVSLYLNSGENDYPDFNFETKSFIQDDMIDVGSGAYPVLADYDGDGLDDLFIANFGYYIYSWYSAGAFLNSVYWSKISLFKNTGTLSNPEFTRITTNFEDLDELKIRGIFPTFGDIDGDNDEDMIIGSENGTLKFFENIAGQGQTMEFAPPVDNYQGIDVGKFSTPQLVDLNNDGLTDLAIGEEDGNLNYYENTGTVSNPVFSLVTDSLGKVDVRAPEITFTWTGYSVPYFFTNNEGNLELIVGSEQGKIFYFKDIENNLTGEFTESDSLYLLIDNVPFTFEKGMRTAAVIEDLNQDGYYDLMVGNYSGGLNYYAGAESPSVISISETREDGSGYILFPNPACAVINMKASSQEAEPLKEINIYNIHADLVITKTIYKKEDLSINIDSFQPGVYFCELKFESGKQKSVYKKFIISR